MKTFDEIIKWNPESESFPETPLDMIDYIIFSDPDNDYLSCCEHAWLKKQLEMPIPKISSDFPV